MAPPALATFDATSSSLESWPKILIPEKVSVDGLALLGNTFEIHQPKSLSPTELLSIIPHYSALIVRSETKVTAEVLAVAKNLKVVARAGVGVDNIDVEAATKHGIIVVNSPSGNIAAAAEHTIALLMAVARNVPAGDRSLRGGKWERGGLVGTEVGGKVLGIVGLGKVGLMVARLAGGLGMKVLALDPYASPEIAEANEVLLVKELRELLPVVDFLTIHTPLIASTLDLIGKEELGMMKKTAKVLNVARGGVYNEQALLDALNENIIAGAGLDVYTSEPPLPSSPAQKLTQHLKVVATPHLGASTIEAQESVSVDVCTQVRSILTGGLPTSAVNAPLILPEEYKKLQPFVKLMEKMGGLYTQHYGGKGVGGKKFQVLYEGELAGIYNTRPLFAALVRGLMGSISERGGRDVNIVNAALLAKEKGIVISETHVSESRNLVYASLVTLKVDGSGGIGVGGIGVGEKGAERIRAGNGDQIISGYVSDRGIFISRLDRFSTSFAPEGTLCVLRNNDEPGKIGVVGGILGRAGINVRFMSVAAVDERGEKGLGKEGMGEEGMRNEGRRNDGKREIKNEALMILGIDGVVSKEVEEELRGEEGIFDVGIVHL
ncbi:D-3-phosphoglycerate dehydrogenase [Sclerotinia borealis F-4128]|uniref:D-3-phosphoglycerate dehydrogenase n=1 Tax=Sclerotinia borealis (strain F-4128) TaxID=1432307 RepID=W9C9P7_SCLBF|nr:D-3-phosphoglycerate dehydrogenase [Sclerotinia borealis F-4128]